MNKELYKVTLSGCDDRTIVNIELDIADFTLLQFIAQKVNETSKYPCQPRMDVELTKETEI